MKSTNKPTAGKSTSVEQQSQAEPQLPMLMRGPQDPEFDLPKFFLSTKRTKGSSGNRTGKFQKSNALVHNNPQMAMTVMQQKMTNIWLKNAQQTPAVPESEVRWKIPTSEVFGQLEVSTRNHKHLEKIINQMMSIKVRWDVMNEKGIAKNYAVVFPYCKVEQGVITYEIQTEVIKLLNEFESYTNINLKEISKLSKKSSIPLYELASRYLNIGYSRWFEWDKFRDMLVAADNIPNNAKSWALFNARYLMPAVEDVNAQTDILVTIEQRKFNRKITHVRIAVTHNNNKNSLNNVALAGHSPEKFELFSQLIVLGFREKSAQLLMKQYSADEIKLAMEYTKKRLEATNLTKLQFPDRYLSHALKNKLYLEPASFTNGKSLELFAAPAASLTENADNKDQGKMRLRQMVEMDRKNNVKIILAEINKAELLDLYNEYNEGIKTKSLHISDGKNKPGVIAAFQDWYAKRLYGEITDKEIVETLSRNLQLR